MECSREVVRNRNNNSTTSGTSGSQKIDQHAQHKGHVEGQEHDARCKEAQTVGNTQESTSQMHCATYKMQQQTNDSQNGARYK